MGACAGKPQPTLYYFDTKGRAEGIRAALYVAGIDFKDKRVSMEEWSGLKPKMPFHQMPVLELSNPDGTNQQFIPQSLAIMRLIANYGKLLPKDPLDDARTEVILVGLYDAVNSVNPVIVKILTGQFADGAEKERDFTELVETRLMPNLASLDRYIASIGSATRRAAGNPPTFIFGNNITIADLAVYGMVEWMTSPNPFQLPPINRLNELPELHRVHKAVCAHQKVKDWQAHKKQSNLQ